MTTETLPVVAVFRPDDERLAEARRLLASLGVEPLADPMLEIVPTGRAPREDADIVVLTSKTGVERAAEKRWTPGNARVCAIGPATATALRRHGYDVDLVPDEYSSAGLVEALTRELDGEDIDVARSDHGSSVLLEGLRDAGADVTETILYELRRPATAGHSTDAAAAGSLDAAVFTSALTVDHFLAAATERGHREAAVRGLRDAVVGAIGQPTATNARTRGIPVDVIPDASTFDALAKETVRRLR